MIISFREAGQTYDCAIEFVSPTNTKVHIYCADACVYTISYFAIAYASCLALAEKTLKNYLKLLDNSYVM